MVYRFTDVNLGKHQISGYRALHPSPEVRTVQTANIGRAIVTYCKTRPVLVGNKF